MRAALLLLLFGGCTKLIAGTSRELPPSLQYDPASFAVQPVPRLPIVPSRLQLGNGVEVFWVAMPEAPLVDVSVMVNCGRTDEPVGQPGLTTLTLRGGFFAGVGDLSPLAQGEGLERLGVTPRVSVDDGFSMVRLSMLRPLFEPAMRQVSDALEKPSFEASAMTTLKTDLASLIDANATRAEVSMRELVRRAMSSSQSGLGQPSSAAALRGLELDAVRAHARKCLQPANLVIALSGDLTERDVRAALQPLAGRVRGAQVVHPPPPPPPGTQRVWLSPSPRGSRVDVAVVARTGPLSAHDRVVGRVLIGALAGLVWDDLRNTQGHVYSVDGDVESGPGFGVVTLRFSTRREVAWLAVNEVTTVLQALWSRWPLSTAVVDALRQELKTNAFHESRHAVVAAAARGRLLHGSTFDPRPVVEQFDEVSATQVAQLFVRAFTPGRLQVIVTGAVDPQQPWAELGTVTAP